jgi:hypothetical protein
VFYRKFFSLVLTFTLLFSVVTVSGAKAVQGGFSNSDYSATAVALLKSSSAKSSYCSGAHIDEYLVITAAHCVINSTGEVENEIWVTPPGANLSKAFTPIIVAEVFTVKGWKNPSTSVINNDIAFLSVRKSLGKPILVKTASSKEVKDLNGQQVTLGGYGRTRPTDTVSLSPLFTQQKVIDVGIPGFTPGTYFHVEATKQESPCPGDSGGPIFKEILGKLTLIAVIAGGNGCSSINRSEFSEIGFLPAAYSDLMNLANDNIAKPAGAPINASSQIATDGVSVKWQAPSETITGSTSEYQVQNEQGQTLCAMDFMKSRLDYSCVVSTSKIVGKEFFVVAKGLAKDSIKIPAGNEAFLLVIAGEKAAADRVAAEKAVGEKAAAEKAAAEKAAADRVAAEKAAAEKAAAEKAAVEKAAADRVAAEKAAVKITTAKKTITCVKGKMAKKITATKPVCPRGYRLKT